VQLRSINSRFFEQGIAGNNLLHLIASPGDYVGGEAKVFLDLRLNLPGCSVGRKLSGLADDVSTLNIGLNLVEPERLTRGAQLLHLHALVGTDVDAAQQGNVNHTRRLAPPAKKVCES